jgi:aryl-alcohol dehydrogenase-like predicted oxidoreductase
MRHLHALVMAKQVLYLGASDTPAWVVVKANDYKYIRFIEACFADPSLVARHNGLTPFSLYQGRWNAAFRDMEAEIIPMCEDQGMAIVSWASLGGGQLIAAEQRKKLEEDPNAGKGYYSASEDDIKVCNVLEDLAKAKSATLQDIVSTIQ